MESTSRCSKCKVTTKTGLLDQYGRCPVCVSAARRAKETAAAAKADAPSAAAPAKGKAAPGPSSEDHEPGAE